MNELTRQLWAHSRQVDRGLRFIDELNACIELLAYSNGDEERSIATDMMKEHLASFNVFTMDVSHQNYLYIRKLQKEYGVEV